MKKIIKKKEKVLRKIAKEVAVSDIKTAKIKKILKEMLSALRSQKDGVAIAAPQIGYSIRIFAVSGRIFSKNFLKTKEEILSSQESDKKEEKAKDLIFVNPKIFKLSREKEWVP